MPGVKGGKVGWCQKMPVTLTATDKNPLDVWKLPKRSYPKAGYY